VQKLAKQTKNRSKKGFQGEPHSPGHRKKNPQCCLGSGQRQRRQALGKFLSSSSKIRTTIPCALLKTNKLGQFAISTPLENGGYTVEISSKEKSFDIMEVAAAGSVLPPIEIKENDG